MTRISFLGAARNVTGSRYLVEAGDARILVDCGLHQERQFRQRDWDPFPVDPTTLDAVVLTHAHLDHVGFLPRLVKYGFAGTVHGTDATLEIARIVLEDSARIQQEDAAYKRRRHEREGRRGRYPEDPLYTVEDAREAFEFFRSHRFESPFAIKELNVTFFEAGHILGASQVRLEFPTRSGTRSLVFSGDLGRWDKPILRDPRTHTHADTVVVESTYGNRPHAPTTEVATQLETVINQTVERGGNIVIPSFAIERTHEVLYYLNQLLIEKRIPRLVVFVDSPMAVSVTRIFERHPELFDEEMTALMEAGNSPFAFPALQLVRTVDQSKAINNIRGSAIIIAGSGMCTGGRIKHHLVNNIGRKESTILFVGYQANGTLGRLIQDGARKIRIHGQQRKVRARIEKITGLSAHAGQEELLRWLGTFETRPTTTFVTHGEESSATEFADLVRERWGGQVVVPAYEDSYDLDGPDEPPP